MVDTASILIIDDNPDDRESYVRSLKKITTSSYRCVEAGGSDTGLIELSRNPYDCVLLDYSLPNVNGLGVLQRIRMSNPYLPVIMLTGQGNEQIAVQAIKEGAHHYLVKSQITPDILDRTIQDSIIQCKLKKDISEKDKEIYEKTKELERSVRDLEDVKIKQESLISKLIDSNTELERFAYVASHDMQEPLRMVTNFSDLILGKYGDKLDSEGREYLGIICESGKRMQALIDDLLEYARIGTEQIRFDTVDGDEEVKHVLQNLQGIIESSQAKVNYTKFPIFKGNGVQFMRIIQNLISNAIKYQPEGRIPEIYVGAEDQGDRWCFYVKDNGMGIKSDFHKEIFQPFRRLHKWNQIRGTGLGLAVCRRIVDMHGGRIWVTSSPDKGSTFYFTIPKEVYEKVSVPA